LRQRVWPDEVSGGGAAGIGKDWEICNITLDPLRAGEVLVKTAVAGICHSDDHFATGDIVPGPEIAEMLRASGIEFPEVFPLLGGHEGAGIVAEVGPEVRSVRPGDRVAMSYIPECGACRWSVPGSMLCAQSLTSSHRYPSPASTSKRGSPTSLHRATARGNTTSASSVLPVAISVSASSSCALSAANGLRS
jgi:Zn-dependent alcohol dehydrogenase